ncbi:hypothetical protein U1Q18_041850 [Sarracenia purpurea var. burkii]
MESLISQRRVRFSDAGKETKEEAGNVRDQRIPPQKTQSFKEERKTQNWLQRRFSKQMSQGYDSSNDDEYQAAVAAAAFAIQLREELSDKDQKKMSDTSLTKIKSKTEDTRSQLPEAGKISRRFSEEPENEKMPEKAVGRVPSIKKTPTFAENHLNSSASRKSESVLPKPDPIKKTPTFAENHLNSSARRKSESVLPKPDLPTGIQRKFSTKSVTEADIWEEAEMNKIKERYEKLNATLHGWEKKKKAKAKRQMDKIESELERRKAKSLQAYRSEVERTDQIAREARAQAVENRRNEEFKVKEKANKIRLTGRIPATCFCF